MLTVLLLVARGVAHTVLPASARRLWTYSQTLHEGLRSCRPRCATVSCWRSPEHGPPADRNGRQPNCCARSRCTSTVHRHRTSDWAP